MTGTNEPGITESKIFQNEFFEYSYKRINKFRSFKCCKYWWKIWNCRFLYQYKASSQALSFFNGTFTLWSEIFDTFNSLIHKSYELINVKLLSYILPLLTDNSKSHIKWLLDISSTSCDSYTSLKHLFNTLQNHIECLKFMWQQVHNWNALLCLIVLLL